MNSDEVCRVCLSASDELKSLHANLYGKNKTIAETINYVVNINIELGKGLPNKICSDCESKLTIAEVFKQRCLESEAILGQHVNIKKEKGYEILRTVLSKKLEETAEYTKKTCLTDFAHNSSTDLLEHKTEDSISSSLSEKDPICNFIKVEIEEIHNDEAISESHDDENYTEELKDETEQDSKSLDLNYDKFSEDISKSHDKAFFCGLCEENFFGTDKYKAHLLSHNDPKNSENFECGLCERKFKSGYTFKKHLRAHLPKIKRIRNIYPCKTCDREFTVESNLTKHVQNGNCSQYTCMGCEKTFLNKERLEAHKVEHIKGATTRKRPKFDDIIQKEDSLPEMQNYESNSSTATITNPEEKSEEDIISQNIDKNERPSHKVKLGKNKGKEDITETNKIVSIKKSTSTNDAECYPAVTKCDSKMSCNTEEQPNSSSNYEVLTCDICEFITSTIQSLKSHLKAHTASMRYSCDSCLFITTDVRSLKLHVKLHTGEKPYFCNVCDKKFSQKGHLDVHVRVHTCEKPYSCKVCGKKFSNKSHLNQHVKIHTGEKPHFCNICDKKFFHKSNLGIHLRVHTGEKPYLCTVCHKEFSQKSNLDRHARLHEKP